MYYDITERVKVLLSLSNIVMYDLNNYHGITNITKLLTFTLVIYIHTYEGGGCDPGDWIDLAQDG